MQRTRKVLLAAAVVTVGQLALLGQSQAATGTWDGGGLDSNLNTPANWVGDVLPATTDSVIFTGATRTTPSTAGGAAQYLGATFDAAASAFNIGGANALTLGATTAGNYLTNSTVGVAQEIDAPVNFVGGTVNAAAGDLVLKGLFNIGNGGTASGNAVNIIGGTSASPTNVTFGGGLTGAATLNVGTRTGSNPNYAPTFFGTVYATGDGSSYTGNVFVNGGALRITNANALGSTGSIETTLTSGGTGVGALELDAASGATPSGFTLAKQVTTRARAARSANGLTGGEVSIRNISGNNIINNVVTGTGGNQYNYESAGGKLTIATWNTSGSGGFRILRLLGASNGEMQNWTPVAGNCINLIKDGTGTWKLDAGMNQGTTATFGAVTVNAGNLILDAGLGGNVVGNSTLSPAVVPNVTVNNGGTLTLVAGADGFSGAVGRYLTTGGSTLTVAPGGMLDASTFTDHYGLQALQTLVAGGTIKTGSQLVVYGDSTVWVGNTTAATPAAGTMNVVGNLSLNNAYNPGTGVPGLHFDLGTNQATSDTIAVTGALSVDNSSGPINVYINPLAGTFTSGTYNLISFTGGSTPNAGDFSLLGFSSGTTRQAAAITTAANQVNLTISGSPASLVWKGDGSGNAWDLVTTADWLNGAKSDKFYNYDAVTFDDTSANKTVNTTGTLQPGGAITVNTTGTYTIAGSGMLSGVADLVKSGSGTVIFANTGDGTSGGTMTGSITINAGAVQLGNGGAEGPTWSGPIADNGTLIINKGVDYTLPAISGTGSVDTRGTANLTMNTANTYTGTTTIEAGTVVAGNGAAFGDVAAGTTVNSGATIYFVNPASTYNEAFSISGAGAGGNGALRAGGAVSTTLAGAITYSGATTLNTDGGATLNMTGAFSGSGDITKTGGGTVVVGGAGSAINGNAAVSAGTLQFGAGDVATDLPTGTLTVASGATVSFGSTQNITVSKAISGAGLIAQGNGGGTTTLTGDLTGFTGTLATSSGGTASTLVVATPTGATTALVADNNGSSSQLGTGYGILRLTNSNALASGATINIEVAQTGGTGHLELGNNVTINASAINLAQRNNLTAAIVSADGSNTLNGPISISTGGTLAALEASAGSTFTFNGTVTHTAGSTRHFGVQGAGNGSVNGVISDNSANAAPMAVTKAGSGTWTLTGANTYTGLTQVNGGKLVLTSAAWTPVLTNAGGADITSGSLVFDYTGASDPVTQVVSLLKTSHDAAPTFTTGQIHSSTADAIHGLGYLDNAATNQLTVKYTYYGDLNLDGKVNGDDYALIDRAYAKGGQSGWVNGDVNYDGVINASDYLLMDTAMGQQNGVLDPALLAERQAEFGPAYVAALTAAVPEPASLGVIGLAAVGLLGRRRRAGR